jgi:hypothetical protein
MYLDYEQGLRNKQKVRLLTAPFVKYKYQAVI